MRLVALRSSRCPHRDSVIRRFFSQERVQHPHAASKSTTASVNSPSGGAPIEAATRTQGQHSRLDRLLSRTPKFLHQHVAVLRSAPVTHISAFLILHELTAVVPLLGLAGAFHYYDWLPSYFSEGAWVMAGVEKFGRYFRRKGWISDQEEERAASLAENHDNTRRGSSTAKWWNRGEGSVKIVVEFATAYAIVKALLIPRLALSAWAAPWFARWTVVPVVHSFKKVFTRGKA